MPAQHLRSWDPKLVEATDFQCWSCTAPVYPKAYRPINRVQAHYSLYDEGFHDIDCQEGAPEAVANGDGQGAISTIPPQARWPSRLLAPLEERKVRGEVGAVPPAVDQRRSTRTGKRAGGGSAPSQTARAYTIGPFVVAYWQMTRTQREYARIDLPGVSDADRYLYAFKQLPAWEILPLKHPRRVFHGKLRWTTPLEDDGHAFKVVLHAGNWDADTRSFRQQWVFRLDHLQWSPQTRTKFVNEIHRAARRAREKNWVPWVFALATQNPNDPSVCDVEQRAHIAIITVDAEEQIRLD